MYEQLKQIGSLKRKMHGLSSRDFIHHLVADRTLDVELMRVKLASNPSLPSYPIELNLNYSVIDKFQSVISVMLPLLEDVDEKGKPVLIESAVATRLVDCLKNRFAFCRKTLRWYAFVGTHWEGLTAPIVDEVVTQLLCRRSPRVQSPYLGGDCEFADQRFAPIACNRRC